MASSKPSAPGWRCPKCGRRFVQQTREHSCDVRSIAMHLERASQDVKDTFEKLQEVLAKLGAHGVVAVKTMILLRAQANFAGVVVRPNWLDLEFVSHDLVGDARIRKTDRFGATRYTHHIRLTSPSDLDAQIVKWLKAAYQIGAGVKKEDTKDAKGTKSAK